MLQHRPTYLVSPPLKAPRCLPTDACPPTARSMEAYGGKPPAMVPVDIKIATGATVKR